MMLKTIIKAAILALLPTKGWSMPIVISHVEVHKSSSFTSDRPAKPASDAAPVPVEPPPIRPSSPLTHPVRPPSHDPTPTRPIPHHSTSEVDPSQYVAPFHQSTPLGPTKCHDGGPAIIVNNTSPANVCYMVELNPASRANEGMDLDFQCGPGSGFNVEAGKVTEICPGNDFIGALTAFHSGSRGARCEINFSDQEYTYYDVDYEMGLDSSTLGPASGEPRVVDGQSLSSLAGEEDVVAKINEAFQNLEDEQRRLLRIDGYINVDDSGDVSEAKMDKDAPPIVVRFLQLDAKLTGYVFPGSGTVEAPATWVTEGEMGKIADAFTWSTECRRMVITAY